MTRKLSQLSDTECLDVESLCQFIGESRVKAPETLLKTKTRRRFLGEGGKVSLNMGRRSMRVVLLAVMCAMFGTGRCWRPGVRGTI